MLHGKPSALIRNLLSLIENIQNVRIGTIVNSINSQKDTVSNFYNSVATDIVLVKVTDYLNYSLFNNEAVVRIMT